ncbi:cytochrome b N-terminal domain-containing protein [Mangrovibacterium diazotrophicum]|uniref:Quinol-cytochrome oxidoreductase complex cytochrome b subunit n=1 Tax=Mangrovibacterium diazotrophicum TaxID=1261403 RepID=A0A419W7M4_9BACT|nr:cytochrome b N-terminal domain-containing protein [Mangrovibacterium diazotrophicum]RKD91458.1 quinol-cytochrome oxidoreductase complex cytochrome b subunit [Mangrovibacterium diazotrophicum]
MAGKKHKTTFGTVALSLFWLILLSGVLLAVPFDVDSPYLSVSGMMVGNPWASFIRNLHYWSSQFFLICSLLHMYDHFHNKERIGLKPGMALRLSVGVLIIFLAMLTGFLLKGDADSLQARQILETLAQRIPIIGESLAFSLLGKPDSFQLIYVHHIATFTIFIAIIMVEHSRRFWPSALEFLMTSVGTLLASYLFSAPLHDNLNPTVKGPWYFVGFQEILHWFSRPEWTLLILLALLALVYFVNTYNGKLVLVSKRSLLVFTTFYFVLTIIGLFFRGEHWSWTYPGAPSYNYSVLHNFKSPMVKFSPEFGADAANNSPTVLGRKESCLACHNQPHGFVDAHKPDVIGCFSCHGGDPFATGKQQSHRNMILIPGNLATASQSCGTMQCHPNIVERVPTGLMSTLSGMISVDRFVFNEQDNPDQLTDVHQLGNSAADEHLKNLCVRCHLGNPKTEIGPITEMSRGGGCLACHLNYSQEAKDEIADSSLEVRKFHPAVSLQVTNNHCFGCHSRSGRISTNYEGWHETTLEASQMTNDSNYRLVEESRVFTKEPEDVHHKAGMECIDCHHSYELMGDGKHYAHEEDQQDVQCSDCHFSGKANTLAATDLDNESALIAALRFGNINNRMILKTAKHQHALINTSVENDSVFLYGKNTGKKMPVKAPAAVCTRNNAHQNLACSSCHSSWAPSCVGCHNSYDPNEPGYDMTRNEEKRGSWVEYIGTYTAKEPALGVRVSDEKTEVIPVTPGMVLTIDKKSYPNSKGDSVIFHRLFAPTAPHTTSAKGRDCKSCHNNPVALGFGEGELTYKIENGKGQWVFNATYEDDPNDGLPADAWTGFLQTREGTVSTRTNVKPFNVKQQQEILIVGACLNCHDENSGVMKRSLENFEELLQQRSSQCILPNWPQP